MLPLLGPALVAAQRLPVLAGHLPTFPTCDCPTSDVVLCTVYYALRLYNLAIGHPC